MFIFEQNWDTGIYNTVLFFIHCICVNSILCMWVIPCTTTALLVA